MRFEVTGTVLQNSLVELEMGGHIACPGWLGGGVATISQYLRAGLVDEMHLAIAPVLLGAGKSGEILLEGIDLPALGYRCVEHVASDKATHIVIDWHV